MTKRTFVSSHAYPAIVHILPALVLLFVAVGLLAFCVNLLMLVATTGVVATLKSMDLNILWGLPLAFILLVFFLVFLVTSYPNIKVYEEGLEIQYLWKFWLFMPWEDVLGLRTEFGNRRIVVVKKLPHFTILPSIDHYHELIRIIEEKTNLEND
jgi:hypothetical protein